jgi:glycine betaine/proline transport system permease protein
MSLVADSRAQTTSDRANPWLVVWAVALASVLALYLAREWVSWAIDYPASARVPFDAWFAAAMAWLKTNITGVTRFVAAIFDVPLRFAFAVLAKGYRIGNGPEALILPPLSWVGVVISVAIAGHAFGGRRLALLAGGLFLYIALFGQWQSAMLTLALIIIAVPLCVIVGLLVGILAWRVPSLDRSVITPALDLMQTIPTFAYLIPMLILFGNSPVSAMLATGIFAAPPMVRATTLALSRVPKDIDEFGTMAGCTRRQKLWRVLIPAARPTLMVGVNQVIMLALNMVIISSMIGAGGLGYDVLLALRALKVGQAMEAGLAIVALAIVLDRLSQAAATRRPAATLSEGPLWRRHQHLLLTLVALAVTTLLALALPAFAEVPSALTFTTAPAWKTAVDWVTVNFFDAIEVFRVTLLLYVLNPLRAFCEGFPWLGAVFLLGLAGYQLGGVRLAALVAALTAFCAVTGLWEKTMATVYLCGVSVMIAALIGIPIGILTSRSDRVQAVVNPIIDTLQTLPSFCFIIPVVMLFRVGDVTALIATVAFAIVPAIRYTNFGLRQVPTQLVEAATVAGCTRWQMFWKVKLPLALPEIVLGINQTVLLALSMIIIAAMIGTRDLGQEVFMALSKADAGRGIMAGLAVAFIGIVADRLIGGASARQRARLTGV